MSFFKFKFSLLVLCLLITGSSLSYFSDNECVRNDFSIRVAHKGKPWGMTENVIAVEKKNCILTINHEKLKFVKSKWVVDVCREPVHIKEGTSTVEVVKKETDLCPANEKKDKFCMMLNELEQVFQDDGLIFAEGERDDLNSDHGHMYCAYLLVMSYLRSGTIFSRDEKYENILTRKNQPMITAPTPIPTEAVTATAN